MSETNERCESCKYFKATDAKSGVWSGTCQNKTISPEGKGPYPSWPNVRLDSMCSFFEQRLSKN